MEIHHHPRHSEQPHKIKEYLFEFLVIFIAITGSFFAENLREHFVDRRTIKEYMEGFLQDLKADSVNLANTIKSNQNQITGLDSLLQLMKKPLVDNDVLRFYNLSQEYATKYYGFNPVTTTMTQLIGTGSIRLIKEKKIRDGIFAYNKAKDDAHQIGEFTGNQISELLDQQTELFDYLSIFRKESDTHEAMQGDPSILLVKDNYHMNAYYSKLRLYKASTQMSNFQLNELKKQASLLISQIQNTYRLD
jgi:hypothetical protein